MSSAVDGPVEAGRVAYAKRAWADAYQLLREVERPSADDLEMLADAARWSGHEDEVVDILEGALAAYATAGDRRSEARVALALAREYFQRNEPAGATGSWSHASRLLEGVDECREHGMLAYMAGHGLWDTKEYEAARALAQEAAAIGRRIGDRDLEALGMHDEGHVLIATGDIVSGCALIDEAAAMSAGAGIMAAGTVYCGAIFAYRNIADWARAREWTDASLRWCRREAVAGFPGLCRFHQAEVRRVHGELEAAEEDVLDAVDELLRGSPRFAGFAFAELGEVRRRRGNRAGAHDAFRRSVELGWAPQPFLAQLYLDEGDVDAAYSSLEAAFSDETMFALERRPHLLPAIVTVALAAGRIDRAAAALADLEAVADNFGTPAFRAAAAHGSGQLDLARNDATAAAARLRHAHTLWCEVNAPFEAAHAQLDLARALDALDDSQAARLAREAALAQLQRIGASADAARVQQLLAPANERLERAFMFTDIVESTKLLDALGDETWGVLLGWHDRTLRAAFAEHGGEEVKHEGDGFFVAFADSASAVRCACAIQRALDAQRHQHGFAPRVRIGIHTDTATRVQNDYQGRGVHVTARVAAMAGAGEILATRDALTAAAVPGGTLRAVSLKGFAEPVEVGTVDWRNT